MRFVLALCVVVGCALCGSAMAGATRRRVRLLESLHQGVRLLRHHMIGMRQPIQLALSGTSCDVLTALGEAMRPGMRASEAWAEFSKKERRRGGKLDALTREDMAILDALFDQLGESGWAQQELLLGNACSALERNLEQARQRNAETDRLYVSLGALTGLMIALILI